jgi:hypothetical protein
VNLHAIANKVSRREPGALDHRLEVLAVPTDVIRLFFRLQYLVKEFLWA